MMGIFKKLGDLARANLNHVIEQLEDPKKLSDQGVLDLGNSKKKAQRLLVSITASLRSAEEKLKPLAEKAEGLLHQAEAFLKSSDESAAKEMLAQKQNVDFSIKNLEAEIAENARTQDSLKRGIKAIDDKMSSLQSSSSIAASNDALRKEDAFATFARMEEKIDAKEYEVMALKELLEDFDKREAKSIPIPTSFDKHSDPDALERELATMKKKLSE